MSFTQANSEKQTLEEILAQPDTRNEWIKFQLALRSLSFAGIGRELGVTRHAVKAALSKSYPKMERAIAAKIGMAPDVIWPERYQKNGVSASGRANIRRRS